MQMRAGVQGRVSGREGAGFHGDVISSHTHTHTHTMKTNQKKMDIIENIKMNIMKLLSK